MGRWVQPPLFTSFWRSWTKTSSYRELNLPDISGIMVYLDGHHLFIRGELQEIERISGEKIEKSDLQFYQKFTRTAEKYTANYLELARKMRKENPNPGLLPEFFKATQEMFTPWLVVFPTNFAVEAAVNAELAKTGLTPIQVAENFSLRKRTPIMEHEHSVREFHQYLKAHDSLKLLDAEPWEAMQLLQSHFPELVQKISGHLEDFEWVGTHHCWGDPLTLEKFLMQIKESLPPAKLAKEPRKLDARLDWLIGVSAELAYWRQYCAECSVIGLYWARKHLAEAAHQLGINYDRIIWMTESEITSALKGGKKLSEEEIMKRKAVYGVLVGSDGEMVITETRVRLLSESLVPKPSRLEPKFSGVVGSKGFALAKAFVAYTPQQAASMEKGSILVVPQTTPDYIMIMKKAGAIVTDEGGITCHAAIVSRELGIPCIVGTKVATRMLKTGDLVEVNAELGTVKKL